MGISDVLSTPFRAGAALRHRRFFHPAGVLAEGHLERLAPPGTGLPMESCAVVARMSKGIGTPQALPDFAGLAWRMPPAAFAATPWDVLLVSAGLLPPGPGFALNRGLLRPVTSWGQAPYSSLMPLRYAERLWWVQARLETPVDGGLTLDSVAAAIDSWGLVFHVEQACGAEAFAPLARLTLTGRAPGPEQHSAFDPVRHTATGVAVWPGWLRAARASAYRGSRAGRGDGSG